MVLTPNTKSIETLKTVVIAVLVTGILAFASGAFFAQKLNEHIANEAKALHAVTQTEQAPSK